MHGLVSMFSDPVDEALLDGPKAIDLEGIHRLKVGLVGGHVDSRRGPGVFFGLRSLRRDDVVEITRSDGRVARFSVTSVQQVAKEQFPTAAVYGPTPRPELRLITCGGRFDRQARSYTDNVVVEAVAV